MGDIPSGPGAFVPAMENKHFFTSSSVKLTSKRATVSLENVHLDHLLALCPMPPKSPIYFPRISTNPLRSEIFVLP
ncbi:hypothetical protein LIER_10832 [Lithospermum erythrorhizon]|uniref:Uncharacterized protein n=1 Tax=Lithospermum erythrorhizon TaxID=34254 RepID=A0AAV3PMT7_LITER